jgi:two-component system cell cycle sensor histidine kinase/response regulator CckA
MGSAFSRLTSMQIEHSEFQDQLIGGLAHRMNNILTLFHGYLGLIMENQKLDKSTREGLARIKDGAHAATELMDRTHSLVRPPAVVWREVKLHDFLRLMKPSFDALCGPQTTVTIDCPDELPPIWADASRVKSAIFEIVRNACEATSAGGNVRLTLGATHAQLGTSAHQPLHWISLKVIDEGPGIPDEIRERIFQPFFSTKKKQNSTGLGLNVAAGFVQQLGGVLRFESAPGETTFELLLPAHVG